MVDDKPRKKITRSSLKKSMRFALRKHNDPSNVLTEDESLYVLLEIIDRYVEQQFKTHGRENDFLTKDHYRPMVLNGLRGAIHDHGPITPDLIGSAVKRIVGQIVC